MTLAFSKYLRGNLDSIGQTSLVSFDKELEHIKAYLQIEENRFGERLNVEFDIHATDFLLPALTVQPIVENAVRYGIVKRKEGGTVCIHTEEAASCFCIVVSDNGVGFEPERKPEDGRSHIGIENVSSRLHSMCNGTLKIDSIPGTGTTATITIPKEK